MSKVLYFEDFVPGSSYELGSRTLTREEIIEFASEFDPQPFHLDDAAGAKSMLGGLAASGWHTAATAMRILADGLLSKTSCQGSPGIDKLSWKRPVYPGDTISVFVRVLDSRPLQSKPGLGLVSVAIDVKNQSGELVMAQKNPILFKMREAAQ